MVKEERVFTKEDLLLQKRKKALSIRAQRDKERLGFEAGRAAAIAISRGQQVDFSREQRQLQELFGHGEKIWGTNMQPVQINNDLNPSRSNPFDETSSMFGGGQYRERSGLF